MRNMPRLGVDSLAWFALGFCIQKLHQIITKDSDSTRRTDDKTRASNFVKINDHVYELRKSAGNRPSVELVFCHGLQLEQQYDEQTYERTWRDRNGRECWLEWLLESEYFPDARILIISYDAWAKQTHNQGRMDNYLLGESLTYSLMSAAVGQNGCPVVLIGHDMGCLVLKEVCKRAHSMLALKHTEWKLEEFLYNIKGFFFFAPPNQGSMLADKINRPGSGAVIRELLILSSSRARLNATFQAIRGLYRWKTYAVAETHGIIWKDFQGEVVPEASARQDVDYFLTVGEDHTYVCRPVDKHSDSFQRTVTCVRDILSEGNNVEAHLHAQELSNTVGLSKVAYHLREMLQNGDCTASHVQHLGLTGMGGVGKTTLAKAIFQLLSPEFDFTCFLEDVKNQVEINADLQTLQRKISDNMHLRDRPRKMDWSTLRGKRVLIVLDDVTCMNHMLGVKETTDFARGSCVIATSRNRWILEQCKCHVHEVQLLSSKDSEKLFCRHAFEQDIVPPRSASFAQLSRRITRKCGGLPLALEVVGKYLHAHSDDELQCMKIWEDAFNRLHNAESLDWDDHDRLWTVLSISYDALGRPERHMFIDIATCFCGENEEEVLAVWRGLYPGLADSAWKKLRDRNLATTTVPKPGAFEKPVITMHQQLQDFGRKESFKYGHWVFQAETAFDLLEDGSWDEEMKAKVKIIKLDSWPEGPRFDISRLVEFPNLRVLWLQYVPLRGFFEKVDSRLISLKCTGTNLHFGDLDCRQPGFVPRNELPPLAGTPSLVHLHLKLADEIFECRSELQSMIETRLSRTINQDYTLDTPSSLRNSSLLQYMVIEAFPLHDAPMRFGALHCLKRLDIKNCRNLTEGCLRPLFEDLAKLERLELQRCSRLGKIPTNLDRLSSLRHLEISNCHRLTSIPPSLAHLSSLRSLKLRNLSQLSHLPKEIGRLENLRDLEIINCNFWNLPPTFTDLAKLESLTLDSCRSLRSIPSTLGRMSGLRRLKLKGLPEIDELPASMGDLKSIQCLKIEECNQVAKIPPSFRHLSGLQVLKLKSLPFLELIPVGLGGFPDLRVLAVSKCFTLKALSPAFTQSSKLLEVTLSQLPGLQNLPVCFQTSGQHLAVVGRNMFSGRMDGSAGIVGLPGSSDRVGGTGGIVVTFGGGYRDEFYDFGGFDGGYRYRD